MIVPDPPVVLVNHLLEPSSKITGITRYLFALLEELVSNRDFRYVLATTWPREDLPEALRVSDMACLTHPFIESTPINVAKQMSTVPRLMRQTQASLEFNCNPIGCFWPSWPRIITLHDLYYELMPENFRWRRRMWWNLMFPCSIGAAAAVICVSEASRGHLVRLHPRSRHKAIVVHEADALKDGLASVEERDLIKSFVSQGPFALYVGNIAQNKNPAVLAKALKLLELRGHTIPIYHVGRDDLGLLADAQKAVDLQNPIRFLGTASNALLAEAYNGARCLVNTSLDEGFCLPVLEAQSRGLPVVCSDIPVLREVAGDGALFFDPNDPAVLADRLAAIFTDERLRAQTAERALKNAALFSWKRAATETEAVFRSALDRRTSRKN